MTKSVVPFYKISKTKTWTPLLSFLSFIIHYYHFIVSLFFIIISYYFDGRIEVKEYEGPTPFSYIIIDTKNKSRTIINTPGQDLFESDVQDSSLSGVVYFLSFHSSFPFFYFSFFYFFLFLFLSVSLFLVFSFFLLIIDCFKSLLFLDGRHSIAAKKLAQLANASNIPVISFFYYYCCSSITLLYKINIRTRKSR